MSELKVDDLTGKTSAGDITVTSEGGAATMQLQQGLAKAWVNFNGTGTIATRDSLNVASLTDNSTGDYYVNITNVMDNDDFSCTTAGRVSGGVSCNDGGDQTTSRMALGALDSGGTRDDPDSVCGAVHGDLA